MHVSYNERQLLVGGMLKVCCRLVRQRSKMVCQKGDEMASRGYIRSSKTKQRIYAVATRLFKEQGYKATTLSDIAKAADVSTGTLFRYFPAKGDFLMEIGRESVDRLKEYADNLPEDADPIESILAVMLEDVRGTRDIFFSAEETENGLRYYANDVRMAYSYEIYSTKNHLDTEHATRGELAGIYASLVEQAKETGRLVTKIDSRVYGQMIVALYFAEFDKGIYKYDYPYEFMFRQRLEALFEGKLCDLDALAHDAVEGEETTGEALDHGEGKE